MLIRFDRNRAAVYLAGYADECALKALLVHSTPMSQRKGLVEDRLRGARAHDLEALHEGLKKRGVRIPGELTRSFTRVVVWSTGLRYETGSMKTEFAEGFIQATEQLHLWVRRILDV